MNNLHGCHMNVQLLTSLGFFICVLQKKMRPALERRFGADMHSTLIIQFSFHSSALHDRHTLTHERHETRNFTRREKCDKRRSYMRAEHKVSRQGDSSVESERLKSELKS
jgi:hypothetical protein